jgi:anaphase-promoting complex subunit 3
VAVGNSFSLKKERTKAIQCFERAIQLDPYFTYAYTLIGHEYVAIEEYVKAMSYYRHAIQISPRHYNAW